MERKITQQRNWTDQQLWITNLGTKKRERQERERERERERENVFSLFRQIRSAKQQSMYSILLFQFISENGLHETGLPTFEVNNPLLIVVLSTATLMSLQQQTFRAHLTSIQI
jgi:hypothetical protein